MTPQAHEAASAAMRAKAEGLLSAAGFDTGLRLFCRHMLAIFDRRQPTYRLMGDAARFGLTSFIIVFDAERRAGSNAEGATAGRLGEAMKTRLASPGRVRAMIAYLVQSGYLAYAPPGLDLRIRTLVPTQALLAEAGRWLDGNLAATETVITFPEGFEALRRDADFLRRYFQAMAEPYFAEGFVLYDGFPEIEALMQHHGGYPTMLTWLDNAELQADGAIVSRSPSGDLAERLMTSRGHVRNLTALGAAHGWLTPRGKGGHEIVLAPAFHRQLQLWVATELVWSARLALRAMAG
jgi:hypothetical protein